MTETAIDTAGAESLDLSPAELALCLEIGAGHGRVSLQHPLLPRLLGLGVVIADQYAPGDLVLAKAEQVEARLREQTEHEAQAALRSMREIPKITHALQQVQRRIDPATTVPVQEVFVPGLQGATEAMARELDAVMFSVCSAQPGHRRPEVIAGSRRRDVPVMAERDFRWRMVYDVSERGNPALADYVVDMVRAGAEVRTTPDPFSRLILVDGRHAFFEDRGLIQDPRRGGVAVAEPRPGAWHCQSPGVVGYLGRTFEQLWERSTPWSGDEADPAHAITTPLQRSILWELEKGKDQTQVAAHFQTSRKRVQRALTDLREALGLKTLWQLGPWWSLSPERQIDHRPAPPPRFR
ncbi:hypothetical protein [Streptomyces sp. CA-111067]|uniref:hypothetical protein n=1 Tax=Streptomyces sp. CA-111067 TaxID=3240046 RepID=UPI003D997DE7